MLSFVGSWAMWRDLDGNFRKGEMIHYRPAKRVVDAVAKPWRQLERAFYYIQQCCDLSYLKLSPSAA